MPSLYILFAFSIQIIFIQYFVHLFNLLQSSPLFLLSYFACLFIDFHRIIFQFFTITILKKKNFAFAVTFSFIIYRFIFFLIAFMFLSPIWFFLYFISKNETKQFFTFYHVLLFTTLLFLRFFSSILLSFYIHLPFLLSL